MLHTVTLPINDAADWTLFQWPDRSLSDRLQYNVDAASWMVSSGETIVSVTAYETAGLTLGELSYLLTNGVISGWSVHVFGLVAGPGAVRFIASLADGDTLEVVVALNTRAASATIFQTSPQPGGSIAVGGFIPTIGGYTITIGGI